MAARRRIDPYGRGVPADQPTIIATSIGFDSRGRDRFDWEPGPIFDLAADLSGTSGTPRVCFLGTATGDDPTIIAAVYSALSARFRASHLELFAMPNVDDVRGHLLAQDVIWVGGGSVANLLALWRLHGWDEHLREAWEAGVVLGGVSAGSICWHNGGTTDSFGPELRPVTNGLDFLPYSNGVHYDSEPQRRPLYHRLIADGTLGRRDTPPTTGWGWCTAGPRWSRRSPTGRTARRTGCSAAPTARRWRPSSSLECCADLGGAHDAATWVVAAPVPRIEPGVLVTCGAVLAGSAVSVPLSIDVAAPIDVFDLDDPIVLPYCVDNAIVSAAGRIRTEEF